MTERAILERAAKLRLDVKNTEVLLERLEGARDHLSSAHDELRMQTTVIRERVAWLIAELDRLQADVRLGMPGSAA